jgi:hypothetical protein
MSNEIKKTQNGNTVAKYTNSRDGYANFGAEGRHTIMRCSKGDWTVGFSRDPAPDGPFVAIMETAARGWVRWQNKRIVDYKINLVSENLPMPHRDSLGDLDETRWEPGFDGAQRDPWQLEFSIVLVDVNAPHEEYIFKGGSRGAKIALQSLCKTYAAERYLHEGQLPVVSLGINTRRDPQYGLIKEPAFKIERWASIEEVTGKAAPKPAVQAKPKPKTKTEELIDDEIPEWAR